MKEACCAFLIALLCATYPTFSAAENVPTEVTDANFFAEVAEASKTSPVVVFAQSTWCGPCKQVLPKVVQLAGQRSTSVVTLDTEKNPITAENIGASGLPTIVIFKNGVMLGRTVGSNFTEIERLMSLEVPTGSSRPSGTAKPVAKKAKRP